MSTRNSRTPLRQINPNITPQRHVKDEATTCTKKLTTPMTANVSPASCLSGGAVRVKSGGFSYQTTPRKTVATKPSTPGYLKGTENTKAVPSVAMGPFNTVKSTKSTPSKDTKRYISYIIQIYLLL